MKTFKIFLIVHFSLFVFHYSLAQHYGWKDISKNLPDYPFDTTIMNNGEDTVIANLSDICFINDDEGWVTAWHAFPDENGTILHTTDGGTSWEVQTILRPCPVIQMLDTNTGYAGSDGGLVFKTTDGGDVWALHGLTGAPITGMSFVPGSDTGYICSYLSSNLHQITPSGVNAVPLGNSGWWHSISAPSLEMIWISDGTSVWTFDEEGLTDQPVSSTFYNSIDFVRNDLGWGAGHDGVKDKNPGTISGSIGKNIPWVHLIYTEQPLYEVFALDESHVWASGFEGYIYYAENASDFGFDTLTSTGWSNVTFVSQPNPRPDVDFLSLFFTSPQNGFASGGKNTLLKYSQIIGVEEHGGLEAEGQGGVELWPNPNRGKFHITNSKFQTNSTFKNEINRVEISDLNGKVVMEAGKQGSGEAGMTFDISHEPAGVYFCRISFSNALIVKKIVLLK